MTEHTGAWTEAQFQEEVIRLAEERGILWHHCTRAYVCEGDNGLPDLILIGKRGVLWLELKSSYGWLKTPQLKYKERLEQAGQKYRVLRPRSLYDGSLDQALDEIA
jgi:hypothetical protein